jgi:hypothetical protein
MRSFTQPQSWDTAIFDACYARVFGRGGSVGDMQLGAQDSALEALSEPRTALVYRPGATGDDAPGGNVYTDWAELHAVFLMLRAFGNVWIEMDNRFSTDLDPEGPDVAGLSGRVVSIIFEDDAFFDDAYVWIANQGLTIMHDGIVHSPIRTTTGRPIHLGGTFFRCVNTIAGAKPMFITTGDPLEMEFDASPLFLGCAPGSENYATSPAVLFDSGAEDLVVIFHQSPFLAGNTLKADNFCAMVTGEIGPMGARGWPQNQPGLTGFVLSVNASKGGGTMPIIAWDYPAKGVSVSAQTPHTAAYTAEYNEVVPVDSSAGGFTVTLPSAGVAQEYVAVKDFGGACGENPVTIAAAVGDDIDGLASIQLAHAGGGYVFRCAGNGVWLPVGFIPGDGQAASISGVIAAAETAHYNRVHQVDSSGGGFALTFPLAATVPGAEIGVSDVGGGANTTTTPASGADTVQNPDVAGAGAPKRWKSDGVSTWVQIA